jgi:hypothetical protein
MFGRAAGEVRVWQLEALPLWRRIELADARDFGTEEQKRNHVRYFDVPAELSIDCRTPRITLQATTCA